MKQFIRLGVLAAALGVLAFVVYGRWNKEQEQAAVQVTAAPSTVQQANSVEETDAVSAVAASGVSFASAPAGEDAASAPAGADSACGSGPVYYDNEGQVLKDGGGSYTPSISVYQAGNAVATWVENENKIWRARFDAATGTWGAPELLEDRCAAGIVRDGLPQMMDEPNGDKVALWGRHDGRQGHVWSKRYDAASGTWSEARLIEAEGVSGDARNPVLVKDGKGNGFAIWMLANDGSGGPEKRAHIWANRYVAGKGWGKARQLDSIDARYSQYPTMAFDQHGNAMAMWTEFVNDDEGTRLLTRRYDGASGVWGKQMVVGTGGVLAGQMLFDENGNLILTWVFTGRQGWTDKPPVNYLSRYNMAKDSWDKPLALTSDKLGGNSSPSIVRYRNGDLFFVWVQHPEDTGDGGEYPDSLWSNHYVVGKGWGKPQLIGDVVSAASVATDDHGNALAVWRDDSGLHSTIWFNRSKAGRGWGKPKLLETDEAHDALDATVTLNGKGDGFAIWSQSDGKRHNIIVRRYIAGKGWQAPEKIERLEAGAAGKH